MAFFLKNLADTFILDLVQKHVRGMQARKMAETMRIQKRQEEERRRLEEQEREKKKREKEVADEVAIEESLRYIKSLFYPSKTSKIPLEGFLVLLIL